MQVARIRCKLLSYSMLGQILVTYFIQALDSTALHYVGKYKYQDVVSFMSSENACSFYPWNLQFIIEKGPSKSGEFCFIYTSLVQDVLAEAQITKVQFKFLATDVNKSFEQSFTQCYSKERLQSVELNITCEGLIAELLLNEPCLEEQMCTGKDDAQNCTSNQNQLKSFCRCNAKYDLSTKLYKKSEYQDVNEKKDCKCNKEQKNSRLFTAVGLVFCIVTCSLFGFIVGLKRRKTNPYRLDCPNSSQMLTRNTTAYSLSEDTNDDRIRIEAYSHNSLDVRAENNSPGSENVNNSSKFQNIKKEPNNDACSLGHIRQKELQMFEDLYSVPLSMSVSSSFTKEHEEIYDELYLEEDNEDTRNVYDNSVHQCPCRDQHVDNDTYDHLHQEKNILSENVYGLSNVSLSALNQQDMSDIENES